MHNNTQNYSLDSRTIETLANNFNPSGTGDTYTPITPIHTFYTLNDIDNTIYWDLARHHFLEETQDNVLINLVSVAHPNTYESLELCPSLTSTPPTKPQRQLMTTLVHIHHQRVREHRQNNTKHLKKLRHLEFAVLLHAFVFDMINNNAYSTTHETAFKINNTTLRTLRVQLETYIKERHKIQPTNFHRLSAEVFEIQYNELTSQYWLNIHNDDRPLICPDGDLEKAMFYIMHVFSDVIRAFTKRAYFSITTANKTPLKSALDLKIEDFIETKRTELHQQAEAMRLQAEKTEAENKKKTEKEKIMSAKFKELGITLPYNWMNVTNAELEKAIWTAPMSKIGEAWGVSNTTIRKTCIHRNIPRPNRKFWAALAKGLVPPGVVTTTYAQ